VQPVLGIGDDAALVQIAAGKQLVVAADTLVEGRHFPRDADPAQIASRAIRVNLSDMAAMGAEPLHYTLCLTLPDSDQDWLESFAAALRQDSELFKCSLIGGDTTRGELCISLQMLGVVETGAALKRSAASIGEAVWVTGNLGDAAAFIDSKFTGNADLANRFWRPQPRIDFALAAHSLIGACIDISDGLVADLGHICSASGVAATLQTDRLPLSQQLIEFAPDSARQLALTGGDDYELCFTSSAESETQLRAIATEQNIQLTRIGSISSGSGVNCLDENGSVLNFERSGYSHF